MYSMLKRRSGRVISSENILQKAAHRPQKFIFSVQKKVSGINGDLE